MPYWKIVDPWGAEAERVAGIRYAKRSAAREECDWLHEKEGLDVYDGFGVYSPYYRPVPENAKLRFNSFGILEYPQECG